MAASNRAAIINKAYKVLKKHYQPAIDTVERSLFENLIYACCLENSKYDVANEAFNKLAQSFFDWNEVRVTTISELAEVLHQLPIPVSAATNVKGALQSIFEAQYSFDLEELKKQNIGKAVKQLLGYKGVTTFVASYVTQHSLAGHSIPIDKGAMDVMFIIGAVTEAEKTQGTVPGLERAIAKKKGPEFASLLHQLGADLVASPFSPAARAILLEIAPDAQPRLPKRVSRKASKTEPADKNKPRDSAATAKPKPRASGGKTNEGKRSAKPSPDSVRKAGAGRGKVKAEKKKKSATKQLAKRKPR